MNILITGASGFIGKRLIELANDYIADDDKLVLLSSKNISNHLTIIHNGYTFSCQNFIDNGIDKIDIVIHIGHYVAKESHWNDTVEGNLSSVKNTFHLLKNLPTIPKRFIFCSSSAVYGLHRLDPVDERSGLRPDSFYAGAKTMNEVMLKNWASEYGVCLQILRLAHIYGPGNHMKNVTDVWLCAAKKNEPIRIFSNPSMYRNWLYIDDCCRMIWRATYLDKPKGIINVVSYDNPTLLELAQICRNVSANPMKIEIISNVESHSEEFGLQFKNNNKARKYLGDEKFSLECGLREEFLYYANNFRVR